MESPSLHSFLFFLFPRPCIVHFQLIYIYIYADGNVRLAIHSSVIMVYGFDIVYLVLGVWIYQVFVRFAVGNLSRLRRDPYCINLASPLGWRLFLRTTFPSRHMSDFAFLLYVAHALFLFSLPVYRITFSPFTSSILSHEWGPCFIGAFQIDWMFYGPFNLFRIFWSCRQWMKMRYVIVSSLASYAAEMESTLGVSALLHPGLSHNRPISLSLSLSLFYLAQNVCLLRTNNVEVLEKDNKQSHLPGHRPEYVLLLVPFYVSEKPLFSQKKFMIWPFDPLAFNLRSRRISYPYKKCLPGSYSRWCVGGEPVNSYLSQMMTLWWCFWHMWVLKSTAHRANWQLCLSVELSL